MRLRLTFIKSSRKPTSPNASMISTAGTEKSNAMPYMLNAATAIMIAIMNIMPPIVGVPSFAECACGPSARSTCPYLSRRSMGMNRGEMSMTAAAAVMKAKIIFCIIRTSYIFSLHGTETARCAKLCRIRNYLRPQRISSRISATIIFSSNGCLMPLIS